MFTGIITDVGRVLEVHPNEGNHVRLVIATALPLDDLSLGASIACSGVCLTVVEYWSDCFAVDVSGETISKTHIGQWQPGAPVNLERALKMGDELGGHMVTGHVDGLAKVVSATPEGASTRWRFRMPEAFGKFIAPKGSIALNGVSLTINDVEGCEFGVNIIPHTTENTTFSETAPGDDVHFEIDVVARYVARLMGQL